MLSRTHLRELRLERRAVLLGIVLGEDEGLTASPRNDFRASGRLYPQLTMAKEGQRELCNINRPGGIVAPGRLRG